MSKYSNNFKLKVVKFYIEQNCSYQDVAKHFSIPSRETIRIWVKKYEEHNKKGLIKNNQKYDGKFKQSVVEYMQHNHLSLSETAIKFNLGNDQVVAKWERIYYEEGPQALYEERRGRNNKMSSKQRKKELSKEEEKNLLEEIQQLRMENAYLKKLQALVQKRTKPKQEKK